MLHQTVTVHVNEATRARLASTIKGEITPLSMGGAVRDAALMALAAGLKPAKAHASKAGNNKAYRAALLLDRAQWTALHDASEQHGMRLPEFIAALAAKTPSKQAIQKNAKIRADAVKASDAIGAEAKKDLNRPGLAARPEQLVVTEALYRAMTPSGLTGAPKVLFCEAATGVGKSISIAAASFRLAAKSTGRIVVAAPSYAILTQLSGAFRRMKAGPASIKTAIAVGRMEYVSAERLRQAIEDQPNELDVDVAQQWLQEQLGGRGKPHPVYGYRWLVESLAAVAPGFAARACALDDCTPQSDPGYREFIKDRKALAGARIILCTHAMLALDNAVLRRRAAQTPGETRDMEWQASFNFNEAPLDDGSRPSTDRPWFHRVNDNLVKRAMPASPGIQGVLPPFEWLFIDEAHLFEQNYAQIISTEVSIVHLRAEFSRVCAILRKAMRSQINGKKTAKSSALNKAERAAIRVHLSNMKVMRRKLCDIGGESKDGMHLNVHDILTARPASDGSGVKNIVDYALHEIVKSSMALWDLIQSLSNRESTPWTSVPEYRRLRSKMADLNAIFSLKPGKSVAPNSYIRMTFSPTLRYPSVVMGSKSLSSHLDFLWRRMKATSLLSATLYIKSSLQLPSAQHMKGILAVRDESILTMTPVVPEWVTSPVTLYQPRVTSMNADWLHPKTLEDKVAHLAHSNRWHAEVAEVIRAQAQQAVGGTLVLCTSYESIKALQALLCHILGDRLICQEQGAVFARTRERFMLDAEAGLRPVWLATGQAGVGLDLSVTGVARDNLLTDLVITRMPYRINRSTTHAWRTESSGRYNQEAFDTAFRLRQWIGRLVRGPNAGAKNLWILDSRIYIRTHQIVASAIPDYGRVEYFNADGSTKIDGAVARPVRTSAKAKPSLPRVKAGRRIRASAAVER